LKRLVVTADDVGLHPGMTRGALAAAEAGIVTAVSVAAVGRAFAAAVERLREVSTSRPDIGVHLTLVGERPLSKPERIPTLVGRDGAFLPGYPALARRSLLGRLAAAEVEAELRLQIERLQAAGLPLAHLNSHQHLHLLPGLFEIVLRLAEEYGFAFLRIPSEPALGPWHRRFSPRKIQLAVLNRLGERARRQLPENGRVAAPLATLGLVDAGHLTVERLGRALAFVADREGGVTELVCHPGLGDVELAAAYDWGYSWDAETAALCDPRLPKLLAERGIELTSFSALTAAPRDR
jgi:predicted glycoside hydrolase/deacetylase ChbG (UPF0249 family)